MSFALGAISLPALRPRPHALRRALVAGSAWGLGMDIALTTLKFQNCGMVCLSDVAITTAVAVAAGILTMGRLAAFTARTHP
jgi:hypothetical protein